MLKQTLHTLITTSWYPDTDRLTLKQNFGGNLLVAILNGPQGDPMTIAMVASGDFK
jgi:hypothetical protein